MSVTEIYEESIKSLPAVERLQLATIILNDIPPQCMVDYNTEWSDEDLEDFRRASRNHIEARLVAHELGTFKGYTKSRGPVVLVFSQDFPTRDEAFHAERQIKGWTRAKKLALIQGDWEKVSRLALRRSRPPHPRPATV